MAYSISSAIRDSENSEYSIYIYHRAENQHEGQSDWEMRSTTRNLKLALDEAYRLFSSDNFRKVEIKQRVQDPLTALKTEQTLKVLVRGHKARSSWLAACGVVGTALACICLLAFYF